jgi:hypothetical protein
MMVHSSVLKKVQPVVLRLVVTLVLFSWLFGKQEVGVDTVGRELLIGYLIYSSR